MSDRSCVWWVLYLSSSASNFWGLPDFQRYSSLSLLTRGSHRLWKPLNGLNLNLKTLEFEKHILKALKNNFWVWVFHCGNMLSLILSKSLAIFLKMFFFIITILLTRQNEGENYIDNYFLHCQSFCHDSLLHVCDMTLKIGILKLEIPWKALNSISFYLYELCDLNS